MATSKKVYGLGIVLFLFLKVLMQTKLFGLTDYSPSQLSFVLTRIAQWLVLLIMFLYAIKVEKSDFLLWKDKKIKHIFYPVSVILLIFGIVLAGSIAPVVMQLLGLKDNTHGTDLLFKTLDKNILVIVFTCLTAGFVEELCFRGYLMPRLEKFVSNKWFAIFISSLLFGLAHLSYKSLNMFISPFLIGIVCAFYYYKFRNIKVLIISHFLVDFVSVMAQS